MTRSPSRVRAHAAGYTLIEVLVALAVLSVAMGAAYGSVIAQTRRHAAQAMLSEALFAGRTAMNVLTAQIGNAGFGVPAASTPSTAVSIAAAEPTRFSFWSSTTTTHTYLTAPAVRGDRTVAVLSVSGIRPGTSLYVVSSTRWFLGTVLSVRDRVVQLDRDVTYNFAAGSLAFPVEQVSFDLAEGALRRNGRMFIPNVTGLTFSYDAKVPEQIRVITISLTVQARGVDLGGVRRTVTVGARVAPPNLDL